MNLWQVHLSNTILCCLTHKFWNGEALWKQAENFRICLFPFLSVRTKNQTWISKSKWLSIFIMVFLLFLLLYQLIASENLGKILHFHHLYSIYLCFEKLRSLGIFKAQCLESMVSWNVKQEVSPEGGLTLEAFSQVSVINEMCVVWWWESKWNWEKAWDNIVTLGAVKSMW